MRKPFEIIRESWGTNRVLVMGHQIFAYERNPTYARRFEGLAADEIKGVLEWQFAEAGNEYRLDLDHPRSFSEKLNWMKLYYHDPLMTRCADKVTVRDYIRETVGEKYLVPLVGVYNSPESVPFDSLPEKFALKVNWGSGQNIICTDRRKLDVEGSRALLRQWMKPESNHYFNHFEWPYRDIQPKIVIERFIDGFDDLQDYKVFCYNGMAKNLYVTQDRAHGMRITYYDRDFKRMPFTRYRPAADRDVPCPVCLDEMWAVAEALAKPFPFVRVDFYVMPDGTPRVGELTFYPGAALRPFSPVEWDYKFGEMLRLPVTHSGAACSVERS